MMKTQIDICVLVLSWKSPCDKIKQDTDTPKNKFSLLEEEFTGSTPQPFK